MEIAVLAFKFRFLVKIITIMRKNKFGANSCVIGEVVDEPKGKVYMETAIGGQRMIDMLAGEQLPRIC